PRPLSESRIPARLKTIIGKLLEKEPAKRYASADEVHRELKALADSLAPAPAVMLSRNARIAAGAALLVVCILAGWLWRRSARERWALQTAPPQIAQWIESGEYVKAAALTREALTVLPADAALQRLWMRATGEVSVGSIPSGAEVSVRPYSGDPSAWQPLGKTPLQKLRMPQDVYVWRVVKPGFATVQMIARPPEEFPAPGLRSISFNW